MDHFDQSQIPLTIRKRGEDSSLPYVLSPRDDPGMRRIEESASQISISSYHDVRLSRETHERIFKCFLCKTDYG